MRKTLSIISGLILLGAPALGADDATPNFAEALSAACQPWMEGAERKALSAILKADGWNAIENALFTKSGEWGRVTIALQQPSGETKPEANNPMKDWYEKTYGSSDKAAASPVKRTCRVTFNSANEPWTLAPAVTATSAWVASTFPKAKSGGPASVTLQNKPVQATQWTTNDVRITQVVQQAKQTAPDFDFMLNVENP